MLLIRYIAYFVGIALTAYLLTQLEISLPGELRLAVPAGQGGLHQTSEYSPVEFVQLLVLFTCGVLLAWVAVNCHSQRTIANLFAGLALIFLLHELDYFLDLYTIVNLWLVLIAIVAALIIVYCYRHWRRFRIAWFRIWPSPGLVLYFAGAVVVFAFAPIVSQEALWQSLLGEAYRPVASAAADEFAELIGYLLWLIGTIEYVQQARALARQEPQTAAAKRRSGRLPKSRGRY
ncbi:MAG: hypothetical protein RLN69_10795 [Woeseiaceae bacterium]